MRKRLVLVFIIGALLVGCHTDQSDYSEKEIVEPKSVSLPKLSDLVDHFDQQIDDINIIYDKDSIKVYGLKVTQTYDEVDEILIEYDDFVFREYNTSLSGSFGMDDYGNISYRNWVIGNSDFEMKISYINVKKEFIENNNEEFYKDVGKNNFVVVIVEK